MGKLMKYYTVRVILNKQRVPRRLGWSEKASGRKVELDPSVTSHRQEVSRGPALAWEALRSSVFGWTLESGLIRYQCGGH